MASSKLPHPLIPSDIPPLPYFKPRTFNKHRYRHHRVHSKPLHKEHVPAPLLALRHLRIPDLSVDFIFVHVVHSALVRLGQSLELLHVSAAPLVSMNVLAGLGGEDELPDST